MNRQYYYLVAGLPDIFFEDKKIPVTLSSFRQYLMEHLNNEDLQNLLLYFWRYDNENILTRLRQEDKPLNDLGNLSTESIDELFSTVKESSADEAMKIAPGYLYRFIEAYRNEEPLFDNKSWDLQLSELYYQHLTTVSNSFIKNWFEFEYKLNNILTALNCRYNGMDVENQLIGSGELNAKLIKSSARDFGISDEIDHLEDILKAWEEPDILEQEKKIDRLKWDILEEESFFHYFTIEKIFTFLIKLSIAERWISLDKDTGLELFKELLNSMETSYEFPEEFSIK